VLKVVSESGLVGFGECEAVSATDLAKATQIVTGKPATAYEVIRQQLLPFPGLQAAINVALLDILGKKAKVPIYEVLGGPTRFKVRVSTALEGETDEALVTSAKRAQGLGFRAFLVPVPQVQARNQGQAFVQATRKRLALLRSAGGDDVDFILDGAGSLSPGDASGLAHELERFHLLWFDEPCRLSNLSVARKIASETVTALGFGQHLHDAGAFQDLLREELIDVLRPSLALNGISQIRKMAALAEAYYVAVAPHHNGGPIATAAALHLAASLPNFFIQQIPLPVAEEDRRMRAELTGSSVERVTDGFAALPTGAGLGIAVNEDALERYKERPA
jgi:galactonate dehydratase